MCDYDIRIIFETPVSLSSRRIFIIFEILHLARLTDPKYISLSIFGKTYTSLNNFAAFCRQSHYLCPQGPFLGLSVSSSLAPYNKNPTAFGGAVR